MPFHIRSKRRCLFLHMLKPHGRSSCFGGFSQGVEPSQELPGLRKCCDLGFLAGAVVFFWPRRAFPWSARGPFFRTSETNSGPRQEPKKGTKMDPQIGPAKKENMLFESKLGVHFGSPKFGVREPSHTACRGRPAASLFVSVSRRQEYGQ